MSLDKQKILNELESVVHQLQSANCGCLGNVFNNKQLSNCQQQIMGFNAPHDCGHNNHGSTSASNPGGHVVRGSCREPCTNVQPHDNCTLHKHPSNLGSTARNDFDPALVQPIVNDNQELKSMTPDNTVVNSPIANHMGLPITKVPQNMCGPCNTANMPDMQKAMENAKVMQAMGNKFMNAVNMSQNSTGNELVNAQTNSSKMALTPATHNVMQCQNCKTAAAQLPQLINVPSQVPHKNLMSANPQMLQSQSTYGQHALGMAKFQELFPGVMGNGDLGFDPMEVAIKMNPNNQQSTQISAQSIKNNPNEANNAITCAHLAAASPHQLMKPLQTPVGHNINMPMVNSSIPSMSETISDISKVQQQTSNGLCSCEQQIYQVSPRQHMVQNKEAANADHTHSTLYPVIQKNMNEVLSGSQKPCISEHIHPHLASVSKVQPQGKTIEYNTLGQPVEMLPAEIYHKPEESLPQTLSPNPNNPDNINHMKAAINTEFMASNKTPCLMSNPMSCGTHSDGQLNINNYNRSNYFIEKTVGDTAVNNNKSPRTPAEMGGDIPNAAQPAAGSSDNLLSPNSARKHRNGLQDIVYTSYPKSTKWSFHGNARKSLPPGQRPA